jgi:hypothetical protein
MLGLEPTASRDEIERAFAREISIFRPRAFGGLAEVGIAYETLRDPARRRAYDESIGLGPKPAPKPAPARHEWAPFMIRASASPAERRAVDPLRRPAPKAETQPRPKARPTQPFVSAPVRTFEPLRRPAADVRPKPVPQMLRPAVEEESGNDGEEGAIDWKRPAVIAGALILGVGLFGAWAGVVAGNEVEAEQAVTVAVPPAKRVSTAAVEPAASALTFVPTRSERRARHASIARRSERARPPLQIALPEAQADAAQAEPGPPDAIPGEAPAPDSPAVTPASVKLPLSNAAIARTIGRIGYACGQVASTSAVEGAGPGVFNVTCTSGHSYRAAPVRGRYHFRRVGSR